MTDSTLRSCPFCGEKRAYVQAVASRVEGQLSSKGCRVACPCGVYGPERYGQTSEEEACKVWENRKSQELCAYDNEGRTICHHLVKAENKFNQEIKQLRIELEK